MALDDRWKSIPGFEGLYEASTLGRVRSLGRKVEGQRSFPSTILKPDVSSEGYCRVTLFRDGKRHRVLLHRLILSTFTGPAPEGAEALHGDDDPLNNAADNLRWGTRAENTLDSVERGRHADTRKTHCPRGHAFEGRNLMRRGTKRRCRACVYIQNSETRYGLPFTQERADAKYAELMGAS